MRRLIIKILYIIAVFFLFLFLFARLMSDETEDQTAVMGSASLPLVRLYLPDGREAGTLHGYLDEMDVRSVRGGILPLASDRTVRLTVLAYGQALDGMRFEVRDITGENLVEQTPLSSFRETVFGDLEASFAVKDLVAPDTEYILILRADIADQTVSYYTRVILPGDESVSFAQEAAAFAADFHESTFDETGRERLAAYMEPDRSGDNSTYARVNIHSSIKQVVWGDLPVVSHDSPSLQLWDVRGDIITLSLTGSIVLRGDDDRQLPCDVTETFRLRRGKSRIYLLDYDRSMKYRFSGDAADFSGDKIELFITPENVPLIENSDGSVLAFSAGRRLFSYSKENNELAVIFSFEDNENADERCTWQNYDFHLLRADENGDIHFLVAGYMNRGIHEGRVGVAYYHYRSSIKQLEEKLFLPVDVSPEILRAYVSRMAHVSGEGELYLMLGDDVVLVDSANQSVSTVIADAAKTPYFRSESGALFARTDGSIGDRITLIQFNSGEMSQVEAEPGTQVIPLGFMQEDLVYGVVNDGDIRRDQTGNDVYAMETVLIRDAFGNILENYKSPGHYVVDAIVEGNQIRLHRVTLNEETGYYEDAAEDQIINTLEAKSKTNRLVTVVTEQWEKTTVIDCRQDIKASSVKILTPSLVLPKEEGLEVFRKRETFGGFYVYRNDGSIEGIYEEEAAAVLAAYDENCAVVDGDDRYVWEKKNLASRNQIMAITHSAESAVFSEGEGTAAFCLKLILEHRGISRDVNDMLERGDSLSEILDRSMSDCRSLTLTGCSLPIVLYYVNQDIPVLVSMQDGSALLVIGYNDTELVIVDPRKNAGERVYKITRSHGNQLFRENGNRFITYYQSDNVPS
ncbi:MAG: hypothetical protein K5696_08710 [Lachnospiraceae bacterium]|nr:hypothetical protein [Lachnospiraceae bacterium]